MLSYLKKNKHLLLVLYWPLHFTWYSLLRMHSDKLPLFRHISSSLDDFIPFIEAFIIPYALWYIYIAVVLFYTYRRSKSDFLYTNFTVLGSMFICMLICTIFPSGLDEALRPELTGELNLFEKLVLFIYKIDTPPRAIFPSMHVAVSISLAASCIRAKSIKRRSVKAFAVVLSVLISLSTVFIKQHSVLDLFAGIGVSAAIILLAGPIFRRKSIKNQ